MKKNKRKNFLKILMWLIYLVLVIIAVFFILKYMINYKKNKVELESLNLQVKIPDGFYYVGGEINTGIVISDNKSDEFKGVEFNTLSSLKGNQFVWVPVENAVVNNIEEAKKYAKKGKNPIAVKDENGYKSIVYTFDNSMYKYSVDLPELQNIEPYIIKEQFVGDKEEFIEGSTKGLYQETFNKMVESVEKNKGFYISRYEIGNLSNAINNSEKIVTKQNEGDISNQSWIDIYKAARKMYEREDISTEIIWGCQMDATWAWILNNSTKSIKVFDLKENGNYNSILKNTGSSEKYSFNNIYDLCGNVSELSQRSSQGSGRIAYGGSYSKSKQYSFTQKNSYAMTYKSNDIGTRVTMYLN